MNVEINVDTRELEKKVAEANKAIQTNLPQIVGKGAFKYADTASKYTPPNRGKNIISAKFYKRKILSLLEAVKEGSKNKSLKFPLRKFSEKIKQGYKYIVEYRKKHLKRFYFKSLSEAKQASIIQNRGLLRVMYGGALNVNGETPKSIKKLIEKSPNLRRSINNLNEVQKQDKKAQSQITLQNRSELLNDKLSNTWLNSMKRESLYQTKREIKNEAVRIVKKVIEKWNNN